jgi:hypothetical protein
MQSLEGVCKWSVISSEDYFASTQRRINGVGRRTVIEYLLFGTRCGVETLRDILCSIKACIKFTF